jgi:very-short-patch-repair endonuclease
VTEEVRDEALLEMAYRWADIETGIENWVYHLGKPNQENIGTELHPALRSAFRVEAKVYEEWNDFASQPYERYGYEIFFDVEDPDARSAAKLVRDHLRLVRKAVKEAFSGVEHDAEIRVVSIGVPTEGQVCSRPGLAPPKPHIDVSDVPVEKPDSNVPLVKKDGYWLTPIEVPFYDALRDTGLVFAVQPWIQGVERRFRLDFLIFYDGGMVGVELDGHESHKSKEQRARDAKRDRWFSARKVRMLRWTGSEVVRNPHECVRELLEILRGRQARP